MSSAPLALSEPRRPAPLIASALFLSETVEGLDDGAGFLDGLTPAESARVRAAGRTVSLAPGESVFTQGAPHEGIFLIEEGRVRVFYSGPSGRQVTLAYWTPGHFIGGPSIYGGGCHQWSGVAIEPVRVTVLSSATLRGLIRQMPGFALCLIAALEAKGRCYTAMAQMLGTRSVIEWLAQLLLNLGELYGTPENGSVIIRRRITHDELAALVGSTRQWVTMMLKRFQREGIVSATIDGAPLDDARIYRVAANDFMLRGGNDYGMLAKGHVLIGGTDGRLLANEVMAYIRTHAPLPAETGGRIRLLP